MSNAGPSSGNPGGEEASKVRFTEGNDSKAKFACKIEDKGSSEVNVTCAEEDLQFLSEIESLYASEVKFPWEEVEGQDSDFDFMCKGKGKDASKLDFIRQGKGKDKDRSKLTFAFEEEGKDTDSMRRGTGKDKSALKFTCEEERIDYDHLKVLAVKVARTKALHLEFEARHGGAKDFKAAPPEEMRLKTSQLANLARDMHAALKEYYYFSALLRKRYQSRV